MYPDIIKAVRSGDFPLTKKLINSKSKLTLKNLEQETIVWTATSLEFSEILKFLLINGFPVNSSTGRPKKSILSLAIEKGNVEILKIILKYKPDLNDQNSNGLRPLHQACLSNNLQIISTLINVKNCNLNVETKDEQTPLSLAVKNNLSSVVSLLLTKGAKYQLADDDGKTILNSALETSETDSETLRIILDFFRNSSKFKKLIFPKNEIFLKYQKMMKSGNKSILHCAVEKEDEVMIRILLNFRISLESLDEKGNTALELAVMNGSHFVVNIFLEIFKDPTVLFVSRGENGSTPLHIAVKENKIDFVELFLKAGVSPNLTSNSGLTPLHIAVEQKNKCVITTLLKNGANVDAAGSFDIETPLLSAAIAGNSEIVEILSEETEQRSTEWKEGLLVMYLGAYYGHKNIVELMLKKKVDPNGTCNNSLAPMHAACQQGHKNIVILLLENGAKVNCKNTFSTPLLAASYSGNSPIIQLLVQNGADVNAHIKKVTPKQMSNYAKILNFGSYQMSEIGIKGTLGGYTALHFATKRKDLAIVKLLIRKGANVNFEESFSKHTPLSLAIKNEDEKTIRQLLIAGANTTLKSKYTRIFSTECLKKNVKLAELLVFHASTSQTNSQAGFLTPLGVAIENDLETCAEKILKTKVDPNIEHRRKPLLHYAVEKQNLNIVKLLLKHNVDVNAKTSHEGTALIIAVKSNQTKIVEILMKSGADINIPKSSYYSPGNDEILPLHIAIVGRNSKIVDIILNEEKVEKLADAFSLAAKKGTREIVEKFLKRGFSIESKDSSNLTPIFHAVNENNFPIVQFLLERRAKLNQNSGTTSPLLYFALTGNCSKLEIIRKILMYGTDANKCFENRSPLWIILNKDYDEKTKNWKDCREELLELLLQNDANPNIIIQGKTPLQLAVERSLPGLVQKLLLYHADINLNEPLNDSIVKAKKLSESIEAIYPRDANTSDELFNESYDAYYLKRLQDRYRNQKSLPFREIVKKIVREIVRRQAIDEEVSEKNSLLLTSKYVVKYYQKCLDEVKEMRVSEISGNVTYYDLLVGSTKKLVSFARNATHEKFYLEPQEKSKFPEFSPFVMEKLKNAKVRKILLDESVKFLKKLIKYNWPYLIEQEIFSYLTNNDMKNIMNAFKKDMFVKS
ncbi:ankyrin-1-like [Leptopilina heterotoma]|uniref:ankyrin-1-like n=1 Tax=Leptopilina heterotoma TaxID=63436 RepID=UPI001CA87F7E|nr:ankyrin-1-like [Leptopilina heterotoma]